MPRVPALLVLLCLGAIANSATLETGIRPTPPVAGEISLLMLTSHSTVPQAVDLPEVEGLEWLNAAQAPRRSIRASFINGRRQRLATASYAFRVQTPGRYRIPSFKVRVDEQVVTTQPREFTAARPQVQTRDGEVMNLESAVFTEFAFDGEPKPPREFYVGESLEVTLNVYILQSIFSGIGYPEIAIENAVFRDYSAENPEFPRFSPAQTRLTQIRARSYVHIPFTFVLSPIKPGPLTGTLTTPCEIRTGRTTAPPGFEGPLFQRPVTRQRNIAAELPEVAVQPLPGVPEEQMFLGLVGDWTLSPKLTEAEVRVGESVSFVLTVAGEGTLELLTPPELELEQFRVYEPEVERRSRGNTGFATLTYVLVPLKEGAELPPLTFCTFNPEAEQYSSRTWTPELVVKPPRSGTGGAVIVDAGAGGANGGAEEEDAPKTDILYVKKSAPRDLPVPLWHRATPFLLLGGVGPVAYVLLTLGARHRRRMTQDAGYRRRSTAARSRAQALHALRRCDADQRGRIIREELTPALSAGLGLPPGTTPTELAVHLGKDDPELADQLRKAEESRYMPGQSGVIDAALVVRSASKLFALTTLFLLCGGAAGAQEMDPPGRSGDPRGSVSAEAETLRPGSASAKPRRDMKQSYKPSRESDAGTPLDAARAAYDRGRIDEALALYQRVSEGAPHNPALLYNRANCHYRLGREGKAVALYERARRLAPRDSDIAENLRFVRRQLGLPDRSRAANPFELLARLRDGLRPDEWLIATGWTLFLWGLAGGWLQFRGGAPRWLHGVALAVVLICVTAVAAQFRGPYRRGVHAVVVSESPLLLRLPDDSADALDVRIPEGREVRVVEERTDWMRIRIGHDEGWMHRNRVDVVW